MTNTDENISFGRKLKELREDTKDPLATTGHTFLTRIRFVTELNDLLDKFYSDNIIQNWENNDTAISARDRKLLCGIILLLHQFNGIKTRQQANELLDSGFYAQLSDKEAESINPAWVNPSTENEQKNYSSPESSLALNEVEPMDFLRGIPSPPTMMIGREKDMLEIKNRLMNNHKGEQRARLLVAIHGRAGVGKSTLAAALANDPDLSAQFSDAVLWISLGQDANIIEGLSSWGQVLGDRRIQQARTAREAHAQLSALLQNKRALLIIDDVWRGEDVNAFMVGGAGCVTLVTTRDEDLAEALATSSDYVYPLKPLDEEDSTRLLKELAPQKTSQYPDQCKQLINVLEGLPLALQIAGRMLRHEIKTGPDILEFIKEINNKSAELEKADPDDRSELIQFTSPIIAGFLTKSVELLDNNTQNNFLSLGTFASKPDTFDNKSLRIAWRIDNHGPGIKKLADYGLVEFLPDVNRYQFHLLLALLAKNLLKEYEKNRNKSTLNLNQTITNLDGNLTVIRSDGPIEVKNTNINQELKIERTGPGSEVVIIDQKNHKF